MRIQYENECPRSPAVPTGCWRGRAEQYNPRNPMCQDVRHHPIQDIGIPAGRCSITAWAEPATVWQQSGGTNPMGNPVLSIWWWWLTVLPYALCRHQVVGKIASKITGRKSVREASLGKNYAKFTNQNYSIVLKIYLYPALQLSGDHPDIKDP